MNAGNPTKRNRIPAACDICRARKVKCDGKRPICTRCSRRSSPSPECCWTSRRSRGAGVSREEIRQLQHRIEELEKEKQVVTPDQYGSTQSVRNESWSDLQENGQSNLSNAMMGMTEDRSDGSPTRFLDSSANSFVREIKSIIVVQGGSPTLDQEIASTERHPHHGKSLPVQKILMDFVLPSRQKADHLMETYWRLGATLGPYLDREDIESRYSDIWQGNPLGEDGQIFLCLLNLIFTLATVMDPSIPPSERSVSADVFYQRAQKYLDLRLTRVSSILTVQCFLILVQYLQSTNEAQQCWIYAGLAIRTAQGLGLDRPSTSISEPSARRRDVLRRTWHGCLFLDRILSITLGRPPLLPAIASNAVPLPTGHDDSSCDCYTRTIPFDPDPGECHFFVESLKYYELISQILVTSHTASEQDKAGEDPYIAFFGGLGTKAIGNLAEIDNKLRFWRSTLPTHLQYSSDAPKSKAHQRQANVLWLRDHHTHILIYRPILSRFCLIAQENAPTLEEIMPWQQALQFSVLCVRTASEVIEFFRSKINSQKEEHLDDFLPSWWYCILYIYTAASILVAARLHPAIVREVSENAILETWHAAIEALQLFSGYTKQASQFADALLVIFSQVPQNGGRWRKQPHQNLNQTRSPGELVHPPLDIHDLSNLTVPTDRQTFPIDHNSGVEAVGNFLSFQESIMPFYRETGDVMTDFLNGLDMSEGSTMWMNPYDIISGLNNTQSQ